MCLTAFIVIFTQEEKERSEKVSSYISEGIQRTLTSFILTLILTLVSVWQAPPAAESCDESRFWDARWAAVRPGWIPLRSALHQQRDRSQHSGRGNHCKGQTLGWNLNKALVRGHTQWPDKHSHVQPQGSFSNQARSTCIDQSTNHIFLVGLSNLCWNIILRPSFQKNPLKNFNRNKTIKTSLVHKVIKKNKYICLRSWLNRY